jgi:hypothetical protein
MAVPRTALIHKSFICFGIMLLCLLTGMGDISGSWQPLNLSVPVIQSGSSPDDGTEHGFKSANSHAAWKDSVDTAKQPSFSRAYFGELKWQIKRICLSSSHNRAPPVVS